MKASMLSQVSSPSSCSHVADMLALPCCMCGGCCRSYNLRVVECRLAAACLALALGAGAPEAREIKTLREVEPRIVDK